MQSFRQFIETVRSKTDLSEFLVDLKYKPFNKQLWGTIGDYLSDQHSNIDKAIGNLIHKSLQNGVNKTVDLPELDILDKYFSSIERTLMYGMPDRPKLVKGQTDLLNPNFNDNTVSVVTKGYKHQPNNVNIADIGDRNFQLWFLYKKFIYSLRKMEEIDNKPKILDLVDRMVRLVRSKQHRSTLEDPRTERIFAKCILGIMHNIIENDYTPEEAYEIAKELELSRNEIKDTTDKIWYSDQEFLLSIFELYGEIILALRDFYQGNLNKKDMINRLMSVSRNISRRYRES